MMNPAKRLFLPHHEHGARAHAISVPALGIYALFIAVSSLTIQVLTQNSGLILGYATDINVAEIVALTNKEREVAGLGEVTLNAELSEAAQKKAEDMFEDDYWAHIARDGTTPWVFIEQAGYDFFAAGENLARDFNNSEAVVRAWMDSPSHKDNILGVSYKDIGVAVVNGELAGTDTTLVVQMFGITRQDQQALALKPKDVEITPQAMVTQQDVPENEVPVIPEIQDNLPVEQENPAGISSRFSIKDFTRSSSLLFISFLFLLFTLDLLVVSRRKTVRVSGNNIAHLGMLLFILVVVWMAKGGLVL